MQRPLAIAIALFFACPNAEASVDESTFSKLFITNEENHFEHTTPKFNLISSHQCDKMQWQIALTPDFTDIIPGFDVIQNFNDSISLSEIEETLINQNFPYFFRARTFANGLWGEWSEPFPFTVSFPPSYPWMQSRSNEIARGAHYKYVQNPYVDEQLWQSLQTYFLPEIHPTKAVLDEIFSDQRVLKSKDAMKKAGFDILKHPQRDMIIARHPKLKGYLVKAYLDKKNIKEYEWWKKRIDGVRMVQNCIDRHHYNSMFKTPKKWIYPLPPEPSPKSSEGITRKDFILVVEDMNILNRKKNLAAYKRNMTPALLQAIYDVLTENGLSDSIFAPNIPFCHDGKIAVLDTEHYNKMDHKLKLWKLARYLSPEMRALWDQIILNYKPPE